MNRVRYNEFFEEYGRKIEIKKPLEENALSATNHLDSKPKTTSSPRPHSAAHRRRPVV